MSSFIWVSSGSAWVKKAWMKSYCPLILATWWVRSQRIYVAFRCMENEYSLIGLYA
ncbi:MAG: hypothetical protein WBG94_08100 [Anaerolineales bacterium]